jgi:Subtilase family
VGSIPSISRLRWPVAAGLLFTIFTVTSADAADWRSRVSPDLLAVYDSATTTPSARIKSVEPTGSVIEHSTARFDASGRVQLDVNFDCANSAPTNALAAAGLLIGTTVKAPPMCVVEGWAATNALPAIASVAGVKTIELPHYAKTPVPIAPRGHSNTQNLVMSQGASGNPAIDGDGVTIMEADKYITQTSVTGAGITVGVINTGADSLAVIQARSELPQVTVVQPSANPPPPANQDEGTVMLEEVHAVAPGASLAFCGPQTYVQYINCVTSLIAANVTVITDDLLFPGWDVMSAPAQNVAVEAIENLLNANPGVMLFSAAGNNAKNYWQGNYTPITITRGSLTCNGQTDNYFQNFTGSSAANVWTLNGSSASDLYLAWLNAGSLSTANYDLYVLNGSGNVVACAAGSGSTAISGSTTYDVIDSTSLSSPNTYVILIGTPDASLSGNFLKLIGLGNNADNWSSTTSGSTSSPQDFAPGVITIGAVDGGDGVGVNIEPFSATGPIQFASGAMMQAPILVAPDDIYVDNVGTSFPHAMFSGTSAASPNSAAVAALIRSAFPSLTSAQTISVLQNGAVPLGASSIFGYGRVDALGALAQIPAPTISGLQGTTIVGGSSSQPLPFSIGGIGTLKVTVTAPIFNAVVAPSNCGSAPGTCTLTLTPTFGALGTATVQVTVTDGANRSSSMQVPITLTAPPPPTVSITSEAMQSVIVKSAIAPIAFSIAGTGPLTVSAAESGYSGLSVNSGCASSTPTCTVNLGNAGTTTGTALLTLTVRDLYGQVTSVTATVIIQPPAAPTISITGGGSQNVTVNAAIAPVTFTLTGMAPLTVTPNTSDISAVTITSGCGTTTMTCTASLGSAQGTPGTANLTLTVEDNYVQSASATATITESAAPSKSGGGALDPLALLGLTGLVLVQLNKSQRKRYSPSGRAVRTS